MNNITIREMHSSEKKTVRNIAYKAFPFFMRLLFFFEKHALLAVHNGAIVGAVLLKIFPLPAKERGGLISFIFTDPDAQGLGVGQKLTEAGISYLEDQGCVDVFAIVEGYNTSSSRLFSTRGFAQLSVFQQFGLYGIFTLPLWFHTSHLFAVGHFMWVRTDKKTGGNPSWQVLWTMLIHIISMQIVLMRTSSQWIFDPLSILAYSLTIILLLALRTGTMYIVARAAKTEVEYRMWESGLFLNLVINFTLGGFFHAPGSLYPKDPDWRYKETKVLLGKMALASSLCLIAFSWLLKIFLSFEVFPIYEDYIDTAYMLTLIMLIIDILLPFFPVGCYNGQKLWNWNKAIWLLAALATVPQVLWMWFF